MNPINVDSFYDRENAQAFHLAVHKSLMLKINKALNTMDIGFESFI